MTTFVGRHSDLAAVKQLVLTERLVTLTGTAGVGKTRLAIAVATQFYDKFADGVQLIELAPLQDPGLVAHTIALQLGLPGGSAGGPLTDLVHYLQDKELLLVVDNCEHLISACAEVIATLLSAAGGLSVLATSRQSLRILGEHIWPVLPLPTPDLNVPGSPEAPEYPAVALFAERAQAARGEFRLTPEIRETVAHICRCVDGIPLAIELAAARMSTLSPDELLVGLSDRYALLGMKNESRPERHHTLSSAVDWSYRLCTPAEQLLWQRVSVFPSTVTLEAAEEICADDELPVDEILMALTGLVDKSILMVRGVADQAEYSMLDTLREFGLDKLRAAGQETTWRRHHRDWYLGVAEQSAAGWLGPHQLESCRRMRGEHANLRAALDFSLSDRSEVDAGQRLVTALWFYWMSCGVVAEGRHWIARALGAGREPTATRARALWVSAWIAAVQGNATAAAAMVQESRPLARRHRDSTTLVHLTEVEGLIALINDDVPRAWALLETTQKLAGAEPPAEVAWTSSLARLRLAMWTAFQGNPDRAIELSEQSHRVADRMGEQWLLSHALLALAAAMWRQGRLPEAASSARKAVRLKRDFHDLVGMVMTVELLAWIIAAQGQPSRAAMLLGAAQHGWEQFGLPLFGSTYWINEHRSCETRCRAAIGDHAFEVARHRGTELPIAHAIAYAVVDERAESKSR